MRTKGRAEGLAVVIGGELVLLAVCEGVADADCDGVPVLVGVPLRVALRVELRVGEAVREGLLVSVREGVPVREGEGVCDGDRVAGGVRELLGELLPLEDPD